MFSFNTSSQQNSPYGQQQPFGQQDPNFGMNVQFSVGPLSTGIGFQAPIPSGMPFQQQQPYPQQVQVQPTYPQQPQSSWNGQPQPFTQQFNADQLVRQMLRETYDDSRMNMLKSSLNSGASFSCSDVIHVINIFAYTEDKMKVILLVYPYIHDKVNFQRVINTFPSENDRQTILKQLGTAPQQIGAPQQTGTPINDQEFHQLLNTLCKESFSSGKHSALGLALQSQIRFTSAQAVQISKVFSFADDKVKVLVALYPRIVDRNNFNTDIQDIPFDSHRTKVRSAIANSY